MNKYLVKIEKTNGDSVHFVEVLYKLKNNKFIKIEDILFPRCNKIKITSNVDTTSYENQKNFENNYKIIDNNKYVIVDLPIESESNFFKVDKYYDEHDPQYTKLFTYINNLAIKTFDEFEFYQVIDVTNKISFNELKHNDDKRKLEVLEIKDLYTKKVYLKVDEKLVGPFDISYSKGQYILKPVCAPSQNHHLKCYNYAEVKKDLINLDYQDFNEFENTIIVYENNLGDNFTNEDFIGKDTLISQVVNKINDPNLNKKNKNLCKVLLKNIEVLSEERKNLVSEIVSTVEFFENSKENIIENIITDPKKNKIICEKIAQEYYSIIKNNENIEAKIKEIQKEEDDEKNKLKKLRDEIFIRQEELEKLKRNRQKELEIKNSDKLDELKSKIEEKEAYLKDISLKLDGIKSELNGYESLEKVIKERDKQESYVQMRKEDIDKEIKRKETIIEELNTNIKSKKDDLNNYSKENTQQREKLLNEAMEKIKKSYEDNAYQYYTANKLFSLSADFDNNDLNKKYQLLNKDNIKELTKQSYWNSNKKIEVRDEIYEFIKDTANRNISKNDVTNILLCISQGFLTIFAGLPGVGKTSLCNILAKSMGINTNDEFNRYIDISVEKGWTSKRDLIGYYNPLTKRFDYANRKLYDCFNRLDLEVRENISDFPCLILLDEANLSPMEYYWAEFMNKCEINSNCENHVINLSQNEEKKLSNTLRFVATINYDHTTEVLSPRLIDRAWIILLDTNDIKIEDLKQVEVENNSKILSYDTMKLFINSQEKELSGNLNSRLNDIALKFKSRGISISPRVVLMIKKYCLVGKGMFEGKNEMIALDYAVSQKILPMINGYGESYKEFLEELKKENFSGMKKCIDIIDKIIENGDRNMEHYQFFNI